MTFQWAKVNNGSNQDLMKSPADWISPNEEGGYKDNPPAGEGSKIILTDTDHLWGIGGDGSWVWKSFLRGLYPILMDAPESQARGQVSARAAMGQTLLYAQRMNLLDMTPQNDLSSTGFCLASLGNKYLVYQPASGPFSVFLNNAKFEVE